MSDLKLKWNQKTMEFDLCRNANKSDLERDEGLETAVIVSLFTDARADLVELPAGETDRRGWFGDAFQDQIGDQMGSKLWLLDREKQTEEVRMKAIEYAEHALQWMIADGVAERVEVNCTFPERGVWDLAISIFKPSVSEAFRFSIVWKSTGVN